MSKTMKCIDCISGILCILALGTNLPSPLLVSAQDEVPELSIAPLCESLVPYSYDSGYTPNATNLTVVSHPGAPWIQLDLNRTRLAPNARLILRGRTFDQELDAHALAHASNGYSAVFDGDAVSVELVHHPPPPGRRRRYLAGEAASRVVVSNVLAGGECAGVETICGSSDDRVPSYDGRQGRIRMGGSCTAWMVSDDVFVTAGHCGTPTSSSRMFFTFDPAGTSVPPSKQYAVELSSFKRVLQSSLSQPDWAVGRLLPNAYGLPVEPDGGWYVISTASWTVGRTIRITGYGTDDSPRNLMQQTHTGNVKSVYSNYLTYNADTMVSLGCTLFS